MIQPPELSSRFPMEISNGVISDTNTVWQMLHASERGDLETVKRLADRTPELLYAQYNYSPPIHFAIREGHKELVSYLLNHDAFDPSWSLYPFRDDSLTIARDRHHTEIAAMLQEVSVQRQPAKPDNGRILFPRTPEQTEFEHAVDSNDLNRVRSILEKHPGFANDETYFWGEGILMMPAKENHRAMMNLLIRHGAKVPQILKWAQFYYFERQDSAEYLLRNGMNPNTMSWQRVTILHDMAQKGFIEKAELLIRYGADLNALDDEYQSTPLGLAARWGQIEMVEFLLSKGADPLKAGAPWAVPHVWASVKEHFEIEKILQNSR